MNNMNIRDLLVEALRQIDEKTKVKPCPFCGEVGTITKIDRDWNCEIQCAACLAIGPTTKNTQKAFEKWNERV